MEKDGQEEGVQSHQEYLLHNFCYRKWNGLYELRWQKRGAAPSHSASFPLAAGQWGCAAAIGLGKHTFFRA